MGDQEAKVSGGDSTLLTQSSRARQEEFLSPYSLDDGVLLLTAVWKQVLGDACVVVQDDVLGGQSQTQEVAIYSHSQGLLRGGYFPDNLNPVLIHQEHLNGSAFHRDDADLHTKRVPAHRVLVQSQCHSPFDAGP